MKGQKRVFSISELDCSQFKKSTSKQSKSSSEAKDYRDTSKLDDFFREMFLRLSHQSESKSSASASASSSPITSLNFCNCIEKDELIAFFTMLPEFLESLKEEGVNIETLILSHNEIGDDGAYHLSNFLDSNSTIKAIHFTHVGMTNIGTRLLLQGLKHNKTLDSFWIGDREKAIDHFFDRETNAFLIASTNISAEEIKAIDPSTRRVTIASIDEHGEAISTKIESASDALTKKMQEYPQILTMSNRRLKKLPDDFVIPPQTTLLDLSFNLFTRDFPSKLDDILAKHPHNNLSIDFSYNKLTNDSSSYIKTLMKNRCVKEINISHNNIGHDISSDLVYYAFSRTNLESFKIGSSLMTKGSIYKIIHRLAEDDSFRAMMNQDCKVVFRYVEKVTQNPSDAKMMEFILDPKVVKSYSKQLKRAESKDSSAFNLEYSGYAGDASTKKMQESPQILTMSNRRLKKLPDDFVIPPQTTLLDFSCNIFTNNSLIDLYQILKKFPNNNLSIDLSYNKFTNDSSIYIKTLMGSHHVKEVNVSHNGIGHDISSDLVHHAFFQTNLESFEIGSSLMTKGSISRIIHRLVADASVREMHNPNCKLVFRYVEEVTQNPPDVKMMEFVLNPEAIQSYSKPLELAESKDSSVFDLEYFRLNPEKQIPNPKCGPNDVETPSPASFSKEIPKTIFTPSLAAKLVAISREQASQSAQP